ncbi:partner of bursicon-like [Babylonia areolata]|uniref:partner of bursicon-like n=1 Tax=Babylonia areolata TaxID=304850 RepID=UPI003FD3E700
MGRGETTTDMHVLPRQVVGLRSRWSSATVTLVMALTFTLTLHSVVVAQGNDNCQLIPVRTNIIKETTVLYLERQVQASCSGEVELHKCEGQCESKVIPSVRHARGFRLDCRCCKERSIITRTVLLNRCFHNGELLPDAEYLAEVNDLDSCSCVSCTN